MSDRNGETVDHPPHYQHGAAGEYETIKVLEAWLTPEQLYGFCIGNAIKYLSRAGKKGDPLECIKKARWYLDYLIARLYRDRPATNGSGGTSPIVYAEEAEAYRAAAVMGVRLGQAFAVEPQGEGWKVVAKS